MNQADPAGADVRALVAAAAAGDDAGWEAIVARFGPLVASVARPYRLCADDVDDVAQATWLALLQHIGRLSEPAALPGWIATTARRECMRLKTAAIRDAPFTEETVAEEADAACPHERASLTERRAALRRALRTLPPRRRLLLELMVSDAAPPYERLAETLGMPVGSIGPTRARSLEQLRRHPDLVRAVVA